MKIDIALSPSTIPSLPVFTTSNLCENVTDNDLRGYDTVKPGQ